jgi:hypothetical protein
MCKRVGRVVIFGMVASKGGGGGGFRVYISLDLVFLLGFPRS